MNANHIKAYIGLGTNLGDRRANLDGAVEMLKQAHGIEVTAVSSYYETAPVGYIQQPDFLNAVVELDTVLSAPELLEKCGEVEKVLKRERLIRWGPRTIDLDLLLYGDSIIDTEQLTVPHPRMHEREFVLKPLSEIAPSAVHPILHKTIAEIYHDLVR